MMKWFPITLALFLAGCSSQVQKVYYQLPTLATATSASSTTISHKLWLESVTVADYLTGLSLVYQSNDVQYVQANNNLWASPLAQQLSQTLSDQLTQELPGWLISTQPLGTDQDSLRVYVTGFHARYDGQAIVSGSWVLNHQGQLLTRTFNLALPQSESGYDGLVRVLASGWQQESKVIAAEVSRLR